MFKLIGLDEVAASLPATAPFDSMRTDEVSLFIAAPGYEDRSSALPSFLRDRASAVDRAILWEYENHEEANGENRREVASILEQCGAEISSAGSFAELANLVSDALEQQLEDESTILVDLSTMTGRLVLEVVALLSEHDCSRVVFGYSEADQYAPSKAVFEKGGPASIEEGTLGLDHGVVAVDSPARMHGFHDSSLQDLVLIIPGFSRDRARACINYVNPALLVSPGNSIRWTVGIPHLPEDAWRADAMRRVHGVNESVLHDELSTFDYKQVFRHLESRRDEEWLRSNLTVAFLGSKLQGVGVALFATVHHDVRVVVAQPETYTLSGYTHGVRAIWGIEFQDWPETLRSLRSVGTIASDV